MTIGKLRPLSESVYLSIMGNQPKIFFGAKSGGTHFNHSTGEAEADGSLI